MKPLDQVNSSASFARAASSITTKHSLGEAAVVHDYLTQRGGAERVVAAWFKHAKPHSLTTLFYEPEQTFDDFRGLVSATSPLNRVGPLRRDPRRALPLLPPAMNRLAVPPGAAFVLASSSGFAHGVRTELPLFVYCHTPARWLYARSDYLVDQPITHRFGLRTVERRLQAWDVAAIRRAQAVFCNSTHVQQRIRQAWDTDAIVVPPPVDMQSSIASEPVEGLTPGGFVLSIGRDRGYKQTELVAQACEQLRIPLVAVGWNAELAAPFSYVTPLPSVSEGELRWLYANAICLATASREDFGLTPVEANWFATPAVCPRYGGFLDSQLEGESGYLFELDDLQDLMRAIRRVQDDRPASSAITNNAKRFSVENHMAALERAIIANS